MKTSTWTVIKEQWSRYNTRHDLLVMQANYGINDNFGREVGHNVYIIPYDYEADKAYSDEQIAKTKKQGSGPLPSVQGFENTKYTASFQITRNNKCYGATQGWKLLKAQTLEDAKIECLKILEKYEKLQIKKWGNNGPVAR